MSQINGSKDRESSHSLVSQEQLVCSSSSRPSTVNGAEGGSSSPAGDFNELMKEEFDWMDQLRDACLDEDRGSEWRVNLLYGQDIPQDIVDRVMYVSRFLQNQFISIMSVDSSAHINCS